MNTNNQPDPKVILSKSDFDRLQQMANANDEQVKSMALDYYHKYGVPSVDITVYLRRLNVANDTILGSFSLEDAPLKLVIYDNADSNTSAIALTKEQKNKISRFLRNTANDIFLQTYGDKLTRINELQRLDAAMRREWRMTRAFTLAGWLTATILLIAAVLL